MHAKTDTRTSKSRCKDGSSFYWCDSDRADDEQDKYDTFIHQLFNQAYTLGLHDLVKHLMFTYQNNNTIDFCVDDDSLFFLACERDDPSTLNFLLSNFHDEPHMGTQEKMLDIILKNIQAGKLAILNFMLYDQNNNVGVDLCYEVDTDYLLNWALAIKEACGLDVSEALCIYEYEEEYECPLSYNEILEVTSLISDEVTASKQYQCWGCDSCMKPTQPRISLKGIDCVYYICWACYCYIGNDTFNSIVTCAGCSCNRIRISLPSLKLGMKLKGGRCRFMYCQQCLESVEPVKFVKDKGWLSSNIHRSIAKEDGKDFDMINEY